MTSTFFGLETGLRGLQAQQAGLDVANHNIANANTPGYSRQNVNLRESLPYTDQAFNRPLSAQQIGTGVTVASIQRARDLLLDGGYRTELSSQRSLEQTQTTLQDVESALAPTSGGIATQLDGFYQAWSNLANDPTDLSARTAVIQQASALAASFNRAASQLTTIRTGLDDQVASDVTQINNFATQIASLNLDVMKAEQAGANANDLRDQRDLLVDKLSELVGVTTVEQPNGSIDVLLGGRAIVQGTTTDPLAAVAAAPGAVRQVLFASDSAPATIASGALSGVIDARDTRVPGYQANLDSIANGLITSVNALHSTGFGQDGVSNRAFFVGSDASTIAVAPVIASDPTKLAAANAAGQAGNNGTALAIAQLGSGQGTGSPASFAALVTQLGLDAQRSEGAAENQAALVQFMGQKKQSVEGVSLDAEAVDMVRYQRAYEAAARVITAMDEMLQTLINQTGLAGR
ncbi:MAG: flagellar hook-associated protein 1 [Chloroflexota bacterium]|jgi:flagellar hook-associated protein 1 FlgK|nr:flagellar hook-associated protein 1 [Chloroflexota bacterium]